MNDNLGIYAYLTTKEEVSVSQSIVCANSQETTAMCLSALCFYSDF